MAPAAGRAVSVRAPAGGVLAVGVRCPGPKPGMFFHPGQHACLVGLKARSSADILRL